MRAFFSLLSLALIPVSLSLPHSPVKRGPAICSDEWRNKYPGGYPDSNAIPQKWKDALQRAEDSGSIPYRAQSSSRRQGGAYQTPNQRSAGDVYDAPEGSLALNFDDGPLPSTSGLLDFLGSNGQAATHFMIGTNILNNCQQFQQLVNTPGQDYAIHTWTHPDMTTLSNIDIVAQLGWTMQIIFDSTGLYPLYWRPPYGSIDDRVSAVARQVFGLQAVLWNQDSNDWQITENNGYTVDSVTQTYKGWLDGSRSPGLIVLEHELSDQAVQVFKNVYPYAQQGGWNIGSAGNLLSGGNPYQGYVENL